MVDWDKTNNIQLWLNYRDIENHSYHISLLSIVSWCLLDAYVVDSIDKRLNLCIDTTFMAKLLYKLDVFEFEFFHFPVTN